MLSLKFVIGLSLIALVVGYPSPNVDEKEDGEQTRNGNTKHIRHMYKITNIPSCNDVVCDPRHFRQA